MESLPFDFIRVFPFTDSLPDQSLNVLDIDLGNPLHIQGRIDKRSDRYGTTDKDVVQSVAVVYGVCAALDRHSAFSRRIRHRSNRQAVNRIPVLQDSLIRSLLYSKHRDDVAVFDKTELAEIVELQRLVRLSCFKP